MAAQWNLIEAHAIILRHKELYPYRGSLELWTAPGDSELDVSYNRPNIVFQKMERIVEGSRAIKKHFVGFKPEIYDGDEEGFRTWRTEDGRAAKPEVVRASEGGDDEKREPSQEELDAMMAQISELAEEERADQERDQEETIKKHLKDAA